MQENLVRSCDLKDFHVKQDAIYIKEIQGEEIILTLITEL